ncbi:hypothetical protein HTY52_18055 [Cupriavidus taiwanensis]|uniref:hypothetical protein n=1 Tax=Cupriavidus taiwanensis TaxID=164546 RepID=UPI001573E8D1|nr:hypothetical protein [Cupriavidus taiwanensis]NSX15991.1 hypothetical protein [Cupriavidus taiwanensis]
MKSTVGKLAIATLAALAFTNAARADEVRNLLGGYEIRKDGTPISGYSWVMVPRVGQTSTAGSTDRVGVAKACGDSLSSVQLFAGRTVTLKLVSFDPGSAKLLADVAIGEITGEGTYPMDGCTATGPIVKQIRKQVLFDVVDGDKQELPLEGGYTLVVGYRLHVH